MPWIAALMALVHVRRRSHRGLNSSIQPPDTSKLIISS